MVEILAVVAILGIIAIMSASVFQNMYTASVLRAGSDEVYRALTSARSETLAAKDDVVYGVHLGTSTVTRFVGPTYIPSASTNNVYTFPSDVTATGTLLQGGGDVIFTRLTGIPSASGVVYVRGTNGTTTITIHASGLVEYD